MRVRLDHRLSSKRPEVPPLKGNNMLATNGFNHFGSPRSFTMRFSLAAFSFVICLDRHEL